MKKIGNNQDIEHSVHILAAVRIMEHEIANLSKIINDIDSKMLSVQSITDLERRIDKLENKNDWVGKLVIGTVILAVIGLLSQ